MRESVVAYRNPLEQWAWESGGMWWVLGLWGVAMVVVGLRMLARVRKQRRGRW